MDFEVRYTEAQQRFRAEVSEWLDDNVVAELIGADQMHPQPEIYQLQRDLGRALGEKGWLYPTAPREYGGGGMDTDAALVIMEELGARRLGLPPYYDSGGVLGGMAILVWGSEEQKKHYLPQIYRGEVRTWQLLTEPEAGSDLANVQTRAVRDGDDWVISGQKIYIGSGNGADAFWTLARTGDPGARHENLSWFWIGREAPGLSYEPMRLIGGSDKNTVFLDEVRVPGTALVGGENNGWKVATTHLELEHGFRPDLILNHSGQRTLHNLVEHCRRTTLDGRRLIDDPVIREQLTRIHTRYEIQRLWGLRNYWLSHQGTQSYQGAQAYYFEKVTGMWMTQMIAETAGPAGMIWDGPAPASGGALARAATSAIGASHGGGTIDIQRVIMARRLGIGRPDAESGATLA